MVGVWLYHVGFPLGYAAGGGASLNPRGVLVVNTGHQEWYDRRNRQPLAPQ